MSFKQIMVGALMASSGLFANAHMMLANPVPYGKSSLDTSPLKADGSDFPCKQRPGVYANPVKNSYAPGADIPISFSGSAVHGGGSCQFAISTDKEPTPSSKWQVIHSIEGGCPAKGAAGNGQADNYTIKLPSDVAPGEYAFQWTWLNRIGNREFYANCALLEVTGGSTKRADKRDIEARREALIARDNTTSSGSYPDLFYANICGSKCTTPESVNIEYPNPGQNVDKFGETQTLVKASCSCAVSDMKATAAAGASGSSATGSSGATGKSVDTGSGSGADSGSGSGTASAMTTAPAAAATGASGAATGASSDGGSGNVLSTAIATATIVSTADPAAATGSSPDSSSSSSSGASSSSNSTASAGGSSTCSGSTAVICSADGSQFGLCNAGSAIMQAVAPGTKCVGGNIVAA